MYLPLAASALRSAYRRGVTSRTRSARARLADARKRLLVKRRLHFVGQARARTAITAGADGPRRIRGFFFFTDLDGRRHELFGLVGGLVEGNLGDGDQGLQALVWIAADLGVCGN